MIPRTFCRQNEKEKCEPNFTEAAEKKKKKKDSSYIVTVEARAKSAEAVVLSRNQIEQL